MYDRVWLAWPCQGLKPARLAEACHEANEAPKRPSGGPCRCGATARRKAGLRRGRWAQPGGQGPWGTPGDCEGQGPPRHLGHLRSS